MVEMNDVKARMEKAIEAFKKELSSLRTGRASAALIDGITVDYYGVPTPVAQTAQVSTPDARQLMIKPYDKSILADVERAINEANIGIAPNNDGEVIRLNIPVLTEETRRDLAKNIKGFAENAKVVIRNIRRDANDALKKAEKAGEITEDDLKADSDDVQKLTDDFIKTIEQIATDKDKDIMTM